MELKYKNVKELAKAFSRGHLKDYYLMVDNDMAILRYNGAVPDGEDKDSYYDRKNDEARKWYRGNGYSDLVDALEAAGIPSEWC
jgi:predicted ATP-dependent endonuclease of OLD family